MDCLHSTAQMHKLCQFEPVEQKKVAILYAPAEKTLHRVTNARRTIALRGPMRR